MEDFQTISKEELKAKMDAGSVIVINVLSRASFETIHLAGSLSIPIDQLQGGEWQKLDKNKEVIVYCANYDCNESKLAAVFLQEKGFNVKAYEGGIKDWSESGYPVEGTMLKFFKIKPKA